MQKQVKYLGRLANEQGTQDDLEKINVIANYPRPKSVKDIRAFIGFAGFYRRFIPNFSDIAKPLTNLTKKNCHILWNEGTNQVFNILRDRLSTKPVLAHPDFSKSFVLTTDASGYAISAILSQNHGTGEHPIAYANRQLNNAEQNYSSTERECLAVVWGIKHIRCFLYGTPFQVITDHRPLSWLRNLKDPSSRLARWALLLSEYEYEIIHRPGKQHGNADFLSRISIAVVISKEPEYLPYFSRDYIQQE